MNSPAQLNTYVARLKVLLSNIDREGDTPNTVYLFPKSGCDRTEFKKILRIFDESFSNAKLLAEVNNGPNTEFARENLRLVHKCEKLALKTNLDGRLGPKRGSACSQHGNFNCIKCRKI